MLKELKIVMAALYLLTTALFVATLYAHTDRSWLTIGHAAVVWLFSIAAPARWTLTLVRRLLAQGITLDRALQITIIMPPVCAALSLLVALNLLRR